MFREEVAVPGQLLHRAATDERCERVEPAQLVREGSSVRASSTQSAIRRLLGDSVPERLAPLGRGRRADALVAWRWGARVIAGQTRGGCKRGTAGYPVV
ncbi:hypothetical protein SAMN04489731_103259 [Amycolatopsis regifaucium]|nr:hypothetical protein SAMN04489731_103259 [Amycolatopsis regifaucium]